MDTSEFEFSANHVRTCSGNGRQDHEYVRFFCRKAVAIAKDAAHRLSTMSDMAHWDREGPGRDITNVSENCRIQIEALAQAISEFAGFFALKPTMAEPFETAMTELTEIQRQADRSYRRIRGWVDSVRTPAEQK